jgi:GntR family transcriptional regulator
MFIALHPSSGVPVYRQVLQQVRERILGGQMARGEQLPSVRELSAMVGINPLTAAKVYQFLEAEGLVETRRGQGTFVAGAAKKLSAASRKAEIEPALRQLVAEAIHLGVGREDLQQLVAATFDSIKSGEKL